jgi:2-oxoglutarate ferredoxin oxidoreductase subunit alpha
VKAKAVFVPEMNQGMIVREVKRAADCATPVIGVNRIDTEMVTPEQILKSIEEVQR